MSDDVLIFIAKTALERIATLDYGGPKPEASRIAADALEEMQRREQESLNSSSQIENNDDA